MNNKLLKNLIIDNFKKNIIIIFSFMLFTFLSIGLIFGLINYTMNFKSTLPEGTFASQKIDATLSFGNWKYRINNLEDEHDFQFQLRPEYEKELRDSIKEETQITPKVLDDVFYARLINNYSGNGSKMISYLQNYGYYDDWIKWSKFLDKINVYGGNIMFWFLDQEKALDNNNFNFYESFTWYADYQGRLTNVKKLDYENLYSKKLFENSVKGKHNLEFKENILYATLRTEERLDLKIGDRITLDTDIFDTVVLKDYIYGGHLNTPDNLTDGQGKVRNEFFVKSFAPDDVLLEQTLFSNEELRITNFHNNNFKNDLNNLFGKYFITNNESAMFSFEDTYNNYFLIFFAITSLISVIVLLMIILNISLSFFMIKEIISRNSSQLIFLKAMGINNKKLSAINSLSIFIYLIPMYIAGIFFSFVIQNWFSSMIVTFLSVKIDSFQFSLWMIIVIVIGILIYLVSYFAISYSLLNKINTNTNVIIKKTELGFKKIRNYLFSKNIPLGLSFTFTLKNINKIITTFFIIFFAVTLGLIAFQFSAGISHAKVSFKEFYFDSKYQVRYSGGYLKNYNDPSGIHYQPTIAHKDEEMNEQMHFEIKKNANVYEIANYLYGNNNLYGKYVTMDDINNLVTNPLIEQLQIDLKLEFNELIDYLKMVRTNLFQTDGNINDQKLLFGVGYNSVDSNYITSINTNFYNSYGSHQTPTLNILDENDKLYKTIFKGFNGTQEGNILPIAMTGRGSQDFNFNLNEISNASNLDIGQGWFEPVRFKLIKTVETPINRDLFVKKDDFLKWLNYVYQNPELLSNGNPKYDPKITKEIIRIIENDEWKISEYTKSDVPNSIRNLIVPSNNLLLHVEKSNNQLTLIDYFRILEKQAQNFPYKFEFFDIEGDKIGEDLIPIIKTMTNLLVLVLVITLFIVLFIVNIICSENDQIIKIMKIMGYKRWFILSRLTKGYILAILVSIGIGILASIFIMKFISNTFVNVLHFWLVYVWSPGFIISLIMISVVLIGIIESIVYFKIEKRELTD